MYEIGEQKTACLRVQRSDQRMVGGIVDRRLDMKLPEAVSKSLVTLRTMPLYEYSYSLFAMQTALIQALGC